MLIGQQTNIRIIRRFSNDSWSSHAQGGRSDRRPSIDALVKAVGRCGPARFGAQRKRSLNYNTKEIGAGSRLGNKCTPTKLGPAVGSKRLGVAARPRVNGGPGEPTYFCEPGPLLYAKQSGLCQSATTGRNRLTLPRCCQARPGGHDLRHTRFALNQTARLLNAGHGSTWLSGIARPLASTYILARMSKPGPYAPVCPQCGGVMKHVRTIGHLDNLPEIQIYYCAPCQHVETTQQKRAA